MPQKYPFPLLIVCILLLFSCAGTDTPFRPGYQVLTLTPQEPGKFILQFGEKGLIRVGEKEYGFLLQSQNSTNNVRIVMEDGGKVLNLGSQMPQTVELKDADANVRFKLSTIIRGSAVIYTYLDPIHPSPLKSTVQESDLIKVNLIVLQTTSVTLTLDDMPTQEITLPAGSKVTWEAKTQADILIPEAQKVELEINGMVFQSDPNSTSIHKIIRRIKGKLVVESP